MNAMSATYVGVDVAKDSVSVRSVNAAKIVTVPNTSQALEVWLDGLPAGTQLICEATGRHHRLMQALCATRRLALTCANPARVRDFAKSLGRLEKTDAIDAEVLLRYGQERRPPATPVPSPALRCLGDLLMARQAVTGQITAFRLRNDLLSAPARRALNGVIRALRSHRLSLERELESWLDSAAGEPWRDQVQTL